MMDFGRFRFSNDDDIIVIIDEPNLDNEKEIEEEDEKVIEITPEMAQDNNNQKLMNKYLNAIGELNFDKTKEKHQDKPSKIETPEEKPIKIVKEDYKNKKLMDKYLHGIGEFEEANYEEEKEKAIEKEPENLMEKYALDKEINYEEETTVVKVNEEYENKELMDKYLHGIGEFKEANYEEEKEEAIEKEPENLMEKYALDKEVNYEEEATVVEVNEEYENKELMDKYLHGIGEFKEANYEEEKEKAIEKEPENLMEKYALDKEVNYEEETNEVENNEEENLEAEVKEETSEEGPKTINIEAFDFEDMTPIELTDDLDAPLLPEPADLSEIVENNINTHYDNVKTQEEEKEVDLGETFKDKPVLAKTKVKKSNPFMVVLIIITFISLGFIGALYVYNSSNKVIVDRTLKHLKEFKQYFNKSFVLDDTDELYMTGDVIFNSNDLDNPLNSVKIKYNFYEDSEKRAADFEIYKENILKLNSKINFSNQKLYILLDELYDKYIQISNYSYSNDELDSDEISALFDYAFVRFTKNLQKENIKSDSDRIIVDNKEINVKKTIITLNEKEIAEVYNKVIDDIISDAYYSKILKKLTKNDLKLNVDNIDTTNMNQYTFSIYTDKLLGSIKGIDLEVLSRYKYYDCDIDFDEDECDEFEFEEEKSLLQYRVGENKEFTIINDDDILLKGVLVADIDEITLNLKNDKDKEIGYIKKTTKKSLTTYEINIQEDDYKVNVELKYQIDEVKQNSEYNIDTTLSFKITDDKKDTSEFSLNTILKVKNRLDKNIDYVTEYVNLDDIDEEDFDIILDKFIDIYYDIFEIEEEEDIVLE